jgi:hypothetical protein
MQIYLLYVKLSFPPIVLHLTPNVKPLRLFKQSVLMVLKILKQSLLSLSEAPVPDRVLCLQLLQYPQKDAPVHR